MKTADTTFLIDLINGKKEILKIIRRKEQLTTTQLNMFEVIRGLFLRNYSKNKISPALNLFESIRVLPLNDSGIIKSAEISSDLIKKGKKVDDIDCFTAGISLINGIDTIVTRNVKHFKLIPGIKVESY